MNNKSKFISSLAHDLKNSIGNNMMYSELLSAELKELAESNSHDQDYGSLLLMSENIRLSSCKLINQINSWVYTQHLISGQYEDERSTFNLISLVESIIASNLLYLDKKNLQIETNWDNQVMMVDFDREILHLILDNLMIQSIIYSNPHDSIKIFLTVNDDIVNFTLADAYSSGRDQIISRFLGEGNITGDEIPEEGILKATGYGMIFCGLALKKLGARAGVEKNDMGGLNFSIQF